MKLNFRGTSGNVSRHPLIAAVILAVALTACGSGEEQVFEEIESPDGNFRLRITVAEPRMPHGRFRIGAYIVKRGDDTGERVIDEKLENDGVPFTTQNLAARWTGPRAVLVCLRATDLPDRGFRIDISDALRVEEIDQC